MANFTIGGNWDFTGTTTLAALLSGSIDFAGAMAIGSALATSMTIGNGTIPVTANGTWTFANTPTLTALGTGYVKATSGVLSTVTLNMFQGGVDVTWFGQGAGAAWTSATTISLFGYNAGAAITTANGCTLIGANAGSQISTSRDHTAVGYNALTGVLTGSVANYYNCAFGFEALQSTTSGHNCAFGAFSGQALLGGTNNSFFGLSTGTSYSGTESNNILIGYNVTGTTGESNVVRIGNVSQTSCYINGIYQVAQTAAVATVNSLGQLGAAAGIITAPVQSATSTGAFGVTLTANVPSQNTLGYDILLNISCVVSSATGATIQLGTGNLSPPSTDSVVNTFTTATPQTYSFSAIVPNNYYILVNTTGTITFSSIICQACPL